MTPVVVMSSIFSSHRVTPARSLRNASHTFPDSLPLETSPTPSNDVPSNCHNKDAISEAACAISCTSTFQAIDMVDKAALVVALSNLEKLQVKPLLTPSAL